MRLPPAPMMYSPMVRIRTTSESSFLRITPSTARISSLMGRIIAGRFKGNPEAEKGINSRQAVIIFQPATRNRQRSFFDDNVCILTAIDHIGHASEQPRFPSRPFRPDRTRRSGPAPAGRLAPASAAANRLERPCLSLAPQGINRLAGGGQAYFHHS